MNGYRWISLGALFAAAAVAAGAMGAHALRGRLSETQMVNFETAVRYQLIHALGLIALGQFMNQREKWCSRVAAWLMLGGLLLFSGGLYGWIFTEIKPLVHMVPVGGTAWIVAWLMFAVSAWRAASRSV